uniref:Ig-like domain-containing protein n=1 Tax=Anabas testudineus TaxID=64144 RepID=A0AAQ6IH04_ANATE
DELSLEQVICMFLLVLDAVLTVEPNGSSFFTGESVTFICDMKEGKDTDWEYRWSKDYLVVGEENRDIRVSQGGIYRCRGRRGKPVYYTDYRYFTLIKLIDGEKITVRCEIQGGGDTEWDYEWKTPQSTSHQTHVNYWTVSVSESSRGNYMCRGRNRRDSYSSTQWSKTFTLTVSGHSVHIFELGVNMYKLNVNHCILFLTFLSEYMVLAVQKLRHCNPT